jgi:hypothetical protein
MFCWALRFKYTTGGAFTNEFSMENHPVFKAPLIGTGKSASPGKVIPFDEGNALGWSLRNTKKSVLGFAVEMLGAVRRVLA